MISLIGIFVITSSAGLKVDYFGDRYSYTKYEQFVRVSTSSDVSAGETARPVCDWIGHYWIEGIKKGDFFGIYEYKYCIYCDKNRVRKEVWEDVK